MQEVILRRLSNTASLLARDQVRAHTMMSIPRPSSGEFRLRSKSQSLMKVKGFNVEKICFHFSDRTAYKIREISSFLGRNVLSGWHKEWKICDGFLPLTMASCTCSSNFMRYLDRCETSYSIRFTRYIFK